MFLSVVILGRFTTETHAMALYISSRHAATTYTTPRDAPRPFAKAQAKAKSRYADRYGLGHFHRGLNAMP